MDGGLQTALDRATSASDIQRPVAERERDALRAALALRRVTASVDLLVRMFAELVVRRDHPGAPHTVDDARAKRANAEALIERADRDARMLGLLDQLIAVSTASGLDDAADEVKAAKDAYLASLAALRVLAEEVIDVMLLREAELDPESSDIVALDVALAGAAM